MFRYIAGIIAFAIALFIVTTLTFRGVYDAQATTPTTPTTTYATARNLDRVADQAAHDSHRHEVMLSALRTRVILLEDRVSGDEDDLGSRIEALEEQARVSRAQGAAIIGCIRNAQGYANDDGAMSHAMMSQCIDDWFDANGARYGVDW